MSALLVGKIRVSDVRDGGFVGARIEQDPTKFSSGDGGATWQQQGGVTQVDDGDLAAVSDVPTVSQGRRQARLAAAGHLHGGDVFGHAMHCSDVIVTRRHAVMAALSLARWWAWP